MSHRRRRETRLLVVLAALLLGATASRALDLDGDGLSDELEQELAERFAPLLVFHPDEQYFPSSVPWYLDRVELWFGGLCGPRLVLTQPWGPLLTGQQEEEGVIFYDEDTGLTHCLSDRYGGRSFSSGYSVDPATQQPRHSRFYLRIPTGGENIRRGDPDGSRIYAHVRRGPAHHPDVVDVTYWFFYPYNPDVCLSSGSHEGDWEHVTVRVEGAGSGSPRLHAMAFAAHGEPEWRRPGDLETTSDGRPVVYVAKGSHASYASAGKQSRDWVCDDRTAWARDDGDGVLEPGESRVLDTRDRVLRTGEWQAGALDFLGYSGFWGSNFPNYGVLEDLTDLGEIHSPDTPSYKLVWPWDDPTPSSADHPDSHPWLFVDAAAGVQGDGRWATPLAYFSADHLRAYHALRCAPLDFGGVSLCGIEVFVAPGDYRGRNAADNGPGIYEKPMRLIAPRGGVTIGR